MSDNDTTYDAPEQEAPVADEAPANDTMLNGVAAPENALVGDENIPAAGDVSVQTVNEDVPAQVTGPPAVSVDTVKQTVTVVQLDEVITDPSSPLAVQIPDAGRGSLDLPFHRLTSPRPEAVFSGEVEADYTVEDSVLDGDDVAASPSGRVQSTP